MLMESIFQKFYSFYYFSHYANLSRQSYMVQLAFLYMELDLCVKLQVNQTYGERGVSFPKMHFQSYQS